MIARATIRLTAANDGLFPMCERSCPACGRGSGVATKCSEARAAIGKISLAADAVEAELVTFAPDDIDWDDEVRVMLEERNSFSPDALTGMEANLRFVGPETHGDEDLRPPVGVAELDLPTTQRRRPRGRVAPLRHRFASHDLSGRARV